MLNGSDRRQPQRSISMLSLLLSSEAHRAALLKILNEAHVSHDITVNQLDGIVGNIVASNYLTFSDTELPPAGKDRSIGRFFLPRPPFAGFPPSELIFLFIIIF